MGNESDQITLTATQVLEQFDEILRKHLEQLIGSEERTDILPLNMTAISCTTLLAEREIEIQSASSSPPERYHHETFLQDLEELGVQPGDSLDTVLRELTEGGYLDVAQDGGFVAKPPVLSMTQLLDRVLPGMPGLNLVAYMVQTMEEVLSGRKELAIALSQLDQTLQMQGTALSKAPARPEDSQKRSKTNTAPQQKKLSPQEAMSLLMSQAKHQRKEKAAPEAVAASIWMPEAVPSRRESGQSEQSKPLPEEDASSETAEDIRLDHTPQGNDILPDRSRTVPDTEDSPIEPTIADASVGFDAALQMESSGETVTVEPTPEEPSGDDEENVASTSEPVLQATSLQGDAVIEVDAEPTAETSSFDEEPPVSEQITPVKQGESDETESTEKIATVEPGWEAPPHNNEENPEAVSEQMPRKASLVTDELVDMDSGSDAPENKTDIGSQTQGVTWADDEVGNRIETFEKELTMPCPICSTGHVKSEQTAKDQLFYLCTSETCDFISWGKPYHLACPLCKNPFLVEITDSAGMNSLKCPRASCRYQGNMQEEAPSLPAEQALKSSDAPPKNRRKVVRKRLVRRKR